MKKIKVKKSIIENIRYSLLDSLHISGNHEGAMQHAIDELSDVLGLEKFMFTLSLNDDMVRALLEENVDSTGTTKDLMNRLLELLN